MDFGSFIFLFRFIPIFFLIYFAVPAVAKNAVLFVGGIAFYAWGQPDAALLLVVSVIMAYMTGMNIEWCERKWAKTAWLVFGVLVNMAILLHNPVSIMTIPAGCLVFTLQAISYLADVYRGRAKAQRNIVCLGVYIGFFGGLNFGPILRYKDMEAFLQNREVDIFAIKKGIIRFIIGLSKKVILADELAKLWLIIRDADPQNLSTMTAWLGLISFGFQLYFTISGYSDMAIGIGNVLGFRIRENFDYPIEATSISQLWKKWHISLGLWVKDYIYIPMGGSKCGLLRQFFNMLIVWSLVGLWYGCAIHYLAFGIWFALWLAMEKMWISKLLKKLPAFTGIIYTWFVFLVSLAFFATDSIQGAWAYAKVLFGVGGNGLYDAMALFEFKNQAVILIVAFVCSTSWGKQIACNMEASTTGYGIAMHRGLEKLIPAILLIASIGCIAKNYVI